MKTAENYEALLRKYHFSQADEIYYGKQMLAEFASQFQVKAEGVSDEEIAKSCFENTMLFDEGRIGYVIGAKRMRDRMLSLLDEKNREIEQWKIFYNERDSELKYQRRWSEIQQEKAEAYEQDNEKLQSELEAVKKSRDEWAQKANDCVNSDCLALIIENKELKSQAEKMHSILKNLTPENGWTPEIESIVIGYKSTN